MKYDVDGELRKMTRRYVADAELEWISEKEIELRDLRGAWELEWIEQHRQEIEAYVGEQEERWRAGVAVELDDLREIWHEEGMETIGDWNGAEWGKP